MLPRIPIFNAYAVSRYNPPFLMGFCVGRAQHHIKLFNLAKRLGHHRPTVPVSIVRVEVELPLVSPHPVLHVHFEQLLIDIRHAVNFGAVGAHEVGQGLRRRATKR